MLISSAPTRPLSLYLVVRTAAAVSVVAVLLGTLAFARTEVAEQRAFQRGVASVSVVAPAGAPAITQDSIDLALVLFGIEVPNAAEHPRLDLELRDRGLTTRGAFLEKARVTVGPAAFSSWGLLGSTLAHEIEIHCQQNFLTIYMMDMIGLDGTGAAERQAYVHELRNAHRFGLEVADAQMIADTMDYYYPDGAVGAAAALPRTVRSWLARNLLRGQRAF